MFKHILVPLDGSDHAWAALEQAIVIAEEEKGDITGLYVVDVRQTSPSYYPGLFADEIYPDVTPAMMEAVNQLDKHLHEQGEAALQQAAARCQEQSVACKTELADGIVSNVILERAQQFDLVVMGERGAGADWSGPMLGSTFEAVVRHAHKPVLVTKDKARALHRILVAYDGSDRAEDALGVATHLLSDRQREMILLTVDDGHKKRETDYEQAVNRLAERGIEAPHLFVKGHPAQVIIETAEKEASDLIVMGAYGHSRFLKVLFGSTVDDVLHSAPCPVLICR
jgi:nucleotide-binding universal stress UspA family protein